jgi:NADH dehydrogenase FAD-containing subunit
MTGNIDVVVIGGGYAGVMTANRLTQRDDVAVTLINPRPTFVERIRLHQLVGGSDDAVVDYREILADGVRLMVDTVTRIDAAERSVTLATGGTAGYDYLIYAVGSGSADPDPVPAENAVRAAQVACSYLWRTPSRWSWRWMFSRVGWSGSVIGSGSGLSGRRFAIP